MSIRGTQVCQFSHASPRESFQDHPGDADGETRVEKDIPVVRVHHGRHDLRRRVYVPADKP